MNTTRKSSGQYEIESALRRYVVKQIDGGWVIVAKRLGEAGSFLTPYGGAQALSDALDTAALLVEHDNLNEGK